MHGLNVTLKIPLIHYVALHTKLLLTRHCTDTVWHYCGCWHFGWAAQQTRAFFPASLIVQEHLWSEAQAWPSQLAGSRFQSGQQLSTFSFSVRKLPDATTGLWSLLGLSLFLLFAVLSSPSSDLILFFCSVTSPFSLSMVRPRSLNFFSMLLLEAEE